MGRLGVILHAPAPGTLWTMISPRHLQHGLVAELATFGLVGGVCLVTDVVLFNVLTFGVGLLPELAKGLTMLVTGTMAFLGHRTVTFRHRQGRGVVHEVPLFALVTVLSLVAGLGPLWLVRSVLGLGGLLWLNAANLLGIALGSAMRYLAYRHVVWARPRAAEEPGLPRPALEVRTGR
jgi:putative flippase GtrA